MKLVFTSITLFLLSVALCYAIANIPFNSSQALEMQLAANWQQASFPVENFQAYSSPFGYRISPSTGVREFHQGLDIAAPLGSYVRNWWGGTVVELSDQSHCGTQITIQSGHWQHIYCHLEGYVTQTEKGPYLVDPQAGVQVWEGKYLPTGARIARVGMTGQTTGPHLHWGLKHDQEFIDPGLILRAMYGSS
ncbi:M23 family metallopeptidase [Gloeocapsa sp. PCC 73106]|uniref:M23 family metallopeptidase n=1 Tax=Gloeocapsa sp. PCC 73106 TaxID=102232 RepID=UPI0002AC8F1A|nr:M23 family metallopeptidase [Gloeocapsa sp. PCC 73106]ELR99217.1 metalloendopeptidase-like membrane protein [Gloeocapsa sp. PCC 73106]